MPSLRRPGTLAALVLAALCATSCGEEDKLSKQEYIVQADKVCADIRGKIAAIPAPSAAAGLKGFVNQVKPLLDDATKRLEKLEPGDDVKGAADALVASTRDARALADALVGAKDQAEVQSLSRAAAQKERGLDTRLRKQGFKACAEPG